jgi:hypothetical protein
MLAGTLGKGKLVSQLDVFLKLSLRGIKQQPERELRIHAQERCLAYLKQKGGQLTQPPFK